MKTVTINEPILAHIDAIPVWIQQGSKLVINENNIPLLGAETQTSFGVAIEFQEAQSDASTTNIRSSESMKDLK